MKEDLFSDGRTGYVIIWGILDELTRDISPNYRLQIIARAREVVSMMPNSESRQIYQEKLENVVSKTR